MHFQNKRLLLSSIVFLLAVMLIPTVLSYEEKIILVRPESKYIIDSALYPEYIQNENIYYLTCIERNLKIRTSVICLDDNNFADLQAYPWEEPNQDAYCYMSSYDLERMPCKNALIQSEYVYDNETIKIEKRIKINRFTQMLDSILKTQFSDGGWKDAVNTASGLYALSAFPTIFSDEISMAYGWLKKYRNDDEKCWPATLCNIHTTARVLSMVRASKVNDSSRVSYDGLSWLVSKHVEFASGKKWNLSIYAPYNTTLTLVEYNQQKIDGNFSMRAGTSRNYTFVVTPGSVVDVVTTENVRINFSNSKNVIMIRYQGDNFTYTIPPACWPVNMIGEECDLFTTELALQTGLPADERKSALEWLNTNRVETETIGDYIGKDARIIETAQYLYATNSTDADLLKWLLLKQNNNGSWGRDNSTNMLNLTAQSALTLLSAGYPRTDERIIDAENWLSDFESNVDSNDTLSKSLIFHALKAYARPFVKAKPMILFPTSSSLELELFNPTPFNFKDLQFELSEELQDYLEIEEKETLSAYSYRKVTLNMITTPGTSVYGKLIISNLDDEIATVPIIISHVSYLELTFPALTEVYGTRVGISVNVRKSPETFECEAFWDSSDISSKLTKFNIDSDKLAMEIMLSKPETIEANYTGTIVCKAKENKISVPFTLKLKRYASKPFGVSKKEVIIDGAGKDSEVVVSNLLSIPIDVTIKFQKAEPNFELSENEITLGPNSDKTIKIKNNLDPDTAFDSSNIIEIKTVGQQEMLTFIASNEGVSPNEVDPMILYISIGIIVIILGVGGFFGYKYRDLLMVMVGLKKKGVVGMTQSEKNKVKIKKLEETGHNMALVNLIRLLRFQGKSDEEIRNRLLQEGFTAEEVDKNMAESF